MPAALMGGLYLAGLGVGGGFLLFAVVYGLVWLFT